MIIKAIRHQPIGTMLTKTTLNIIWILSMSSIRLGEHLKVDFLKKEINAMQKISLESDLRPKRKMN